MIYETFSEQQTYELGLKIASNTNDTNIFCLNGDLGVGKTIFAKGFAKGLGIDEMITSPTFSLVNEYSFKPKNFYHFDLYRITNVDDAIELGILEYFSNGICLIEWSENITDILPKNRIEINISKDYLKDEDYRKIEVLTW